MKKPVEYFDTDFLGTKIEIGDKVIIEEPNYKNFIIGTVVTKAPNDKAYIFTKDLAVDCHIIIHYNS